MTQSDISRYDPVWRTAEPYMRARKNDVHIPMSFAWCLRLLDEYPEADRDVCALATMLHDIGWSVIDMERILAEGFRSEKPLQSDVRYLHEAEGVRLARPVLEQTGWSEDVIAQVLEIIDGHDTRARPHHLNDRIMRDSDKLWRFEVPGISVACDWFGMTPRGYADKLAGEFGLMETDAGRAWAEEALKESRKQLILHVI